MSEKVMSDFNSRKAIKIVRHPADLFMGDGRERVMAEKIGYELLEKHGYDVSFDKLHFLEEALNERHEHLYYYSSFKENNIYFWYNLCNDKGEVIGESDALIVSIISPRETKLLSLLAEIGDSDAINDIKEYIEFLKFKHAKEVKNERI